MHAQTLVRPENLAATKEEEEAFGKLPKSEQERLKRVAAKMHANTGHRNVEALAKQLRQMGAIDRQADVRQQATGEQLKTSGNNSQADKHLST